MTEVRRVLITGGSGYVGRNLIRGFVDRGWQVSALARSDRAAAVVEHLGATPRRGDVLDRGAMIEACRGSSLLIHAAADTGHGEGTPEQEKVNVEGTRTVLEAARAAGVRRAIQISSESVLADGRPLRDVEESHPIPARLAGSYSRTKAAAERCALEQNRDNLEVIVIRPRFVWGRDDSSILPALIEAVRSGRLRWISGGRYLTSTTHVANLVEGVAAAAERGRPGEVYFLTDGAPIEFRQIVTELLAARGVAAPSSSVPRFVLRAVIGLGSVASKLSARLRPPMSFQEYATIAHEVTIRIDKARHELGYQPVITIDEGLAELRRAPWAADAPSVAAAPAS